MARNPNYFDEQVWLETEDCIIWPYGQNRGYGTIVYNRKTWRTSRLALVVRGIKQPSGKDYALHRCNTPLCFNYRHLYWGNAKDNALDRYMAGGDTRGEKNGNGKLTSDQVKEIREMSGTNKQIAKQFNIGASTVCEIKNRKRWAWL